MVVDHGVAWAQLKARELMPPDFMGMYFLRCLNQVLTRERNNT